MISNKVALLMVAGSLSESGLGWFATSTFYALLLKTTFIFNMRSMPLFKTT